MGGIDLEQLAIALTGVFENRDQAIASPVWFVSLRLWQRRTPLFVADSVTLFLEQANALKQEQPYRQRLLRLQFSETHFTGQYYQFRDFAAWRGAGAAPERLAALREEDVVSLEGCEVAIAVTPTSQGWLAKATLPPEGRCCFEYAGQERQVLVGFELEVNNGTVREDTQAIWFRSFDRGIDPQTGQGLWGALMGPYEFLKET